MFEKYKSKPAQFTIEGRLFSCAIKNETEKIFVATSWLTDAKHGLINRKRNQTIDVINLIEIKNWKEIKKILRIGKPKLPDAGW